jgi:TonB family protein
MAYSKSFQSTLETLGGKLQEPIGIATLASVAVHGILWLFLPLLPISPVELEEPEIRGSVQVLELTPEEMTRLPDLPDTEIPAQPQTPSNPLPYTLQPMPNPFSNRLPTPLPPAPRFRDPSNIFVPPLLPPIPPRSSVTRRLPQQPQQRPAPRPTLPIFPRGGLAPSIEPTTPASPTPGASPTPSATATPTQPAISMEQMIAQQRELLTYNADGTTADSALQSYTAWFGEAVKLLGEDWDEENAKRIDITAPYPRVACLNKLEGTTVVGAVVDEEGKLLEELPLTLIQSSGYPLFNQAALDLVKDYAFEATENKQVYQMNVAFKFNADTCPAAFTTSPSPSPTPANE